MPSLFAARRVTPTSRFAAVARWCVLLGLLTAAPASADTPSFDRAFGFGLPNICSFSCGVASPGAAAGQLSAPQATALGSGEIFVADRDNNRISVFTAAGSFARAFGKGVNPVAGANPDVCTAVCAAGSSGAAAGELASPTGVAVTATEVFVSDSGNDRVSVFSRAGEFLRSFGSGSFDEMRGLTVSVGQVYVADEGSDQIVQFTAAGAFVRTFGAGSLTDPSAVAIGSGRVFVSERTANVVSVFSSTDGTFQSEIGSSGSGAGQLGGPAGVALSLGELYVSESANRRVSVFSTAVATFGQFRRAFGAGVDPDLDPGVDGPDVCTVTCQAGSGGGAGGRLDAPAGLAVSGEVYIADATNNRVSVSTSAGAFDRAFAKDVGLPALTCTTATGCRTGAPGFVSGQLTAPTAVDVSGGEVFVADSGNHRISVFQPGGGFARALGMDVGGANVNVCSSDCAAGTSGVDPEAIDSPSGVAVSGGLVYVADQSNDRVTVLDATTGTLSRTVGASGWGAGSSAGRPPSPSPAESSTWPIRTTTGSACSACPRATFSARSARTSAGPARTSARAVASPGRPRAARAR